MKHQKSLKVSVEKAQQMAWFCQFPNEEIERDEPVFDQTVTFDDGRRVVIQVVASTQPEEESCWTQGVLFGPEGTELAVTEPGEDFLGEYCLFYEGDEYEVVVETNMRDFYPEGECPDCGEPISPTAVNGDNCPNCEHVFNVPDTYPVKLAITVDAPSYQLPEQVAELVDFIIKAGLSDALASAELPEEDQMGDPGAAVGLEISTPEVVPDGDVYYQPDGAGDPDAGTTAANIRSFHVYRSFHNARNAHPGLRILAFTGDDIQEHKFLD